MIRVVVAEDSATVRALLVAILQSDQEIQVVGEARDGREAVQLATRLRPDLVTMDVQMPVMNGLEATKEIMAQAPAPILIVSSHGSPANVDLSLDAVRAGALMVVPTPGNPESEGFAESRAHLLAMVKAMAGVKVVRRWTGKSPSPATPPVPRNGRSPIRLVAVATSTGGPAALQRILARLPRRFPVPIVVVQHIATGFVDGLAGWLGGTCDLHVRVAREGETLKERTVYIAPDDRHLSVTSRGRIVLADTPPIGGFRPSANYLFEQAAEAYGAGVAAIILTGMGVDGVEGLKAVRAAGGLVIAQDEATSVVYGMPAEAVAAGVVNAVLPITEIAPRLLRELGMGDAG